MQIGWNWNSDPTQTKDNRIEYNYIHDIGQNVLSDLGGIYTVGENLNTIVGNNVIHDVYCWVAWVRAMNNNLYWRIDGEPVTYAPTGLPFSQWKSLTGLDANSLEADPMFKDPKNGDFSFV